MAKTLLLVICSALLVHFQPEDSVAMYEADERSRHPPGADIDSDMEAKPIQVTLTRRWQVNEVEEAIEVHVRKWLRVNGEDKGWVDDTVNDVKNVEKVGNALSQCALGRPWTLRL